MNCQILSGRNTVTSGPDTGKRGFIFRIYSYFSSLCFRHFSSRIQSINQCLADGFKNNISFHVTYFSGCSEFSLRIQSGAFKLNSANVSIFRLQTFWSKPVFDLDTVGLCELLLFPGCTHLFRTTTVGQSYIFST